MKLRASYILLGATAAIWTACGGQSEPTAGQLALASAGSHLDGSGPCATLAQLDSVCPADLDWDNHGQYVSCVARYLDARVAAGDIDEEQKGALVSEAAHSSVGKKGGKDPKAHGKGFDGCDDSDDGDGGVGGTSSSDDDDDHDDDDDAGTAGGFDGHDDDDDAGAAGGSGHDDDDDDAGGAGGCSGRDDGDASGESGAGGHP
jgi:hypothetical protein